MPVRLEPFITNRIYHIFNKTLDKRRLFQSLKNCEHFLQTIRYYRSTRARLSFSKLRYVGRKTLQQIQKEVDIKKYFRVDILAYCLMPNHFHLLLKQKVDGGIQRFIANTVNSMTRYCNLQLKRKGPLFLPKFKSEQIRTDEQLLHVSRYIHLNPYSSGMIKTFTELIDYPWSSLPHYVKRRENPLTDSSVILAFYNGEKGEYKDFVLSNAEYQKTLEYLKHAENW